MGADGGHQADGCISVGARDQMCTNQTVFVVCVGVHMALISMGAMLQALVAKEGVPLQPAAQVVTAVDAGLGTAVTVIQEAAPAKGEAEQDGGLKQAAVWGAGWSVLPYAATPCPLCLLAGTVFLHWSA